MRIITKDIINEWLKDNTTQTDLAKKLGIHQSSVCGYLKRHNIKMPSHKIKSTIPEHLHLAKNKVGVCQYIDRYKGTKFIEVYSTEFNIKNEIKHILRNNGIKILRERNQIDKRVAVYSKPTKRWTLRLKEQDKKYIIYLLKDYYTRVRK